MRRLLSILAIALATAGAAQAQTGQAMLVLDGSGSMWGRIDDRPKITIAREAVRAMLETWPQEQEIGLMAYGHRAEGDCADIETLVSPAPLDAAGLASAMERVSPRGKTPVGGAVERAAAELSGAEQASVIVVTDGLETCGADLCALGDRLAGGEIDLTAHVIGFDVDDSEGQLACLATATGGQYLAASDANTLTAALGQVSAPEPAPSEPVFVDEFEREALGEGWSVDHPDPSGFILDGGALVTMTVQPGYMGKRPDQANIFRWTEATLPEGDWDLAADFSARMGEVQSLGGRRAIVQLGRYEDVDNNISTYVFRQGNSNDDLWLRLRAVSGGTETRAEVEIAGDTRGYDLARILRDFEEKGARLTLEKRGRDYVGRLSMNGWAMQEGGPEEIETDPVQILRSSGDPAIFAGTLGSEQTVAEFSRIEIREVE